MVVNSAHPLFWRNQYRQSVRLNHVRIMVCGPIGNGGNSKIRRVSEFLMKNGFEVADQFDSGGGDYSGIRDFAGRKALSNLIVRQDLRLVRSSDVLVVLPIPSFGAAMERFYATRLG